MMSRLMGNLDTSDHRILSELQRDASLSMDVLSERVHLSRNACWRRIKAMEASGLIRGRVTLLDPARAGCPLQVIVLVRTSHHDAGWMAKFDTAVRAMPEIVGRGKWGERAPPAGIFLARKNAGVFMGSCG